MQYLPGLPVNAPVKQILAEHSVGSQCYLCLPIWATTNHKKAQLKQLQATVHLKLLSIWNIPFIIHPEIVSRESKTDINKLEPGWDASPKMHQLSVAVL